MYHRSKSINALLLSVGITRNVCRTCWLPIVIGIFTRQGDCLFIVELDVPRVLIYGEMQFLYLRGIVDKRDDQFYILNVHIDVRPGRKFYVDDREAAVVFPICRW
ncbi:hypothetical protein ALC56_09818 [Trachymyrmex septentrionalis]|uniref:Uncharacterized protein n=1 Tax=Trachymyrmex septentrionalis TaxID=34720 RepID=A0A151JUD2_9HYME|nr:hypothetical protein ALC56_09818 [Trachymyrmex septentrionalis]